MSEHTETPWAIHDNGSFFDIGVPYGGFLGVYPTVMIGVDYRNEANARHIVRCVNSHDRLMEALRDVTENLEHARFMVPDGEVSSMLFDSTQAARAILQELEGEL